MIVLPLLGAGVGAGLMLVLAALRPARPDPLVHLGRLYASTAPSPTAPADGAGRARIDRVGAWLARELSRRGVRYTTLRQDAALTGRSFELLLGRKLLLAAAGFLFGLLLAVSVGTAGLGLPYGTPLLLGAGGAAAFFLAPDLEARQDAGRRRREFRRALSAYLDWVSLQMSGRAAAEQALPDAARIGGGWPLALIRHTVFGANRAGQNVWQALADLGERIGVPQLRELGSLVRLVAHDGARVRDTLTARAASLRAEELADAQGVEGKRDQSMLLAQILLGVGFAVFVGYPAVVNLLRV